MCDFTSVFGHHGGVETLRLLESDGQCGATAHAQTDHRRGLWATCAGKQRRVNKHDEVNVINEQNGDMSGKSQWKRRVCVGSVSVSVPSSLLPLLLFLFPN